jgi:hypothetical protein
MVLHSIILIICLLTLIICVLVLNRPPQVYISIPVESDSTFPSNPKNGDWHIKGARTYKYSGKLGVWQLIERVKTD